MTPTFNAISILQALPEPALLIETTGRLVSWNHAVTTRLGLLVGKQSLTELIPDEAAVRDFRGYLVRCSGSLRPLPGAVALRSVNGDTIRFRTQANLLAIAQPGQAACLLLRLYDVRDARFAVLSQKVRDLNAEIRRRRHIQAILEESIRDRDLLMRELHHRVNNNIHMLVGMLSAARRDSTTLNAAAILDEVTRRLVAVGTAHRLLYSADNLHGVSGDQFVNRLAETFISAGGGSSHFSMTAEPVVIPNDAIVPLALILNELVANALKHAVHRDSSPPEICITMASVKTTYVELTVEDDGPGFDPTLATTRRASGLSLVRGLARQLGGSVTFGRSPAGGARCTVKFEPRTAKTAITQ